MTVSVLVPRGGACQWRDRAWVHVRNRYETDFPDWEIVEGRCDDDAWSKGAAVADALHRSTGDVLVLADADSFVDSNTMRSAVAALDHHPWVVPHFKVYRLGIAGTERVYRGEQVHIGHTIRMTYVGPMGGGIVVMRRDDYEAVGGIDPRFRGWGGEDISFGWALSVLVGVGHRLDGDLWHLWHPHAANRFSGEVPRGSDDAEELAARYKTARTRTEMLELTEEGRCLLRRSTTSTPS